MAGGRTHTAISTSGQERMEELGKWRAHDLWFADRGRATVMAGMEEVDSRMALSIAPFMMGSCEMENKRDWWVVVMKKG